MGLENGFIVKGLTDRGKRYLKDKWKDSYDEDFKGYDFGYFRKFWGLRREIVEILPPCPKDEEGYEIGDYVLTMKDIEDILQILKENLNEHIYEQRESLWDYHIGIKPIANAIYKLTELVEDIEYGFLEETDVEVTFYDSY